jgi:hypothetical protein
MHPTLTGFERVVDRVRGVVTVRAEDLREDFPETALVVMPMVVVIVVVVVIVIRVGTV